MPNPDGSPVRSESGEIAVVCVGNSLVADDAAGSAVFHRLNQQTLPSGVRLHHLGVGGMSLLELLAGEHSLLVVDAVRFGSSPGTIHFLSWQQLPGSGGQAVSLHGIGIRDAIEVGRIAFPQQMPEEVYLLGIEGECFDSFVTEMSPAVQAAVEKAAEMVLWWVERPGERGTGALSGFGVQGASEPVTKDPVR